MKQQEASSSLKAVFLGISGGLTGAVVMGAFASLVPLPGSGGVPFFVLATEQLGLGSFAGWLLHFGTGAAIGAIFGVTVNTFRRLRISSVGHGVRIGIVAGVVVWVAFFVPTMALLTPSLISSAEALGIGLVANIIFAVALVIAFGYAQTRFLRGEGQATCKICGATFTSRRLLKNHSRAVHQGQSVREISAP